LDLEQLRAEFGIALDRFGGRANASLGKRRTYRYPARSGTLAMHDASAEGWKGDIRMLTEAYCQHPDNCQNI
jgi:hypothetical protein